MQFTSLLALAPLALAAPLTSRAESGTPGIFTVISARSASPVHLLGWTVRDGGVFLSGESSAYCPDNANIDCSGYSNTTAFGANTAYDSLSLNDGVPGGQQAYIQKNGALGYTQAHSASIPEGASRTGFSYTAPAEGQSFGYLSYKENGATGFVACTADDGTYQVFADVDGGDFSNCLGFDALASPYSGKPAWEFTG